MENKTIFELFTETENTLIGLVEVLKKYIKSDAPLDDRWKIYLQIEKYLPDVDCFDLRPVEDDLECDELTYYDDFNMNRHANRSLSRLVDMLQEDNSSNFHEIKEAEKQFCEDRVIKYYFQTEDRAEGQKFHKDLLDKYIPLPKFKEAIMQSGMGSTTNDW